MQKPTWIVHLLELNRKKKQIEKRVSVCVGSCRGRKKLPLNLEMERIVKLGEGRMENVGMN